MRSKYRDIFTTVRTEGGLLPGDLLQRIADGDKALEGLTPEAYHLADERLNDAISRSWKEAQRFWGSLQKAKGGLGEKALGTTETRERWLLPLFQQFGYGRLQTAKAHEMEGKSYAISHAWENVPIHLVSYKVKIDKRMKDVAGASRASPHGLLQEFLNRSDKHLWGIVSNGHRVRLLRDNVSLTRLAYLEFDLESMMEGEVYSDFVLLWLLCHQSRVEGERREQCILEKWTQAAQEQGTRALEQLRRGVEEAINALGSGFLGHRLNTDLREKLKTGTLHTQDFYRQLLRMVYRMLFLFVAEHRDVLLDPNAAAEAKERYRKYYSLDRIRKLAEKRRGTRHGDLWQGLRLVMGKLGDRKGCPELALPPLGSFLWEPGAIGDLAQCEIENRKLLRAAHELAFTVESKVRRAVDYKNLGSEELGSIYEALLEMHPDVNPDAATFSLSVAAGHERKTTGSYYTPTSLINCLLDSALEPVIADAIKAEDPEKALLNLKVCDPACGSGHFLVAAAHRMAKRLASIRSGDEEPSPEDVRHALRDVVGRCLYGVDINPMSVELCKVSLWMEALEPGKPLSFLDHHIKCGNSLLGTTPALLAKGIPDEAFKPIEGDDKAYCSQYKKHNKKERESRQLSMFDTAGKAWEQVPNLSPNMAYLDEMKDETIYDIGAKARKHEDLRKSEEYKAGKFVADAWCAAFVWRKRKDAALQYPITEEAFHKIEDDPAGTAKWLKDEVERLTEQYQFFHWHLEYPDVFRMPGPGDGAENEGCGWNGGFSCVLGNPPWEHTELKEKEFFALTRPEITNAQTGAIRKKMIAKLCKIEPILYEKYLAALRYHSMLGHYMGKSGRFPFSGKGRINTYAVFAELKRSLKRIKGQVGCIVPSGIATDDTTKHFFQDLIKQKALSSLYDFENRKALFEGVHRSYKFCLLNLRGSGVPNTNCAEFVFFAHDTTQLKEEERKFFLTTEEIGLINPNTKTCPIFRWKRDAEITKRIYGGIPILVNENDEENGNRWGVAFKQGLFNMTSDSALFKTLSEIEDDGWELAGNIFEKGKERLLPLYEGRMISHFDHRVASVGVREGGGFRDGVTVSASAMQHADPNWYPQPRYWVREDDVGSRLHNTKATNWFIAFKDVTSATNERTAIVSIIPKSGVGHKSPMILLDDPENAALLLSIMSSFPFDYIVRQKLGGVSLTFFIVKQIPVPWPNVFHEASNWLGTESGSAWVRQRCIENVYTSHDMSFFALDNGFAGKPFVWDEQRRFVISCELNAMCFHLYGVKRNDVGYIMETFPIVKRKDEEVYGEYRTKRVIIEIYDQMAKAMETGKAYQTRLDPPPGDVRCTHGYKEMNA